MSDAVRYYYSDQSTRAKAAGAIPRIMALEIIGRELADWGPDRRYIVLRCREGMLFGKPLGGLAARMAEVVTHTKWDRWEAPCHRAAKSRKMGTQKAQCTT